MIKKVKRYLLEEEAIEPFDFIGICTAHSDYRLAWHLNARFDVFFEKNPKNIEIPNKKSGDFDLFSYYSFHHPQDLSSYFLIRNKQNGRLLLSEKPSIDYFLTMQDNYIIEQSDMIENLRKMDSIIAVFGFNSKEFALSEYLIFEK